MKKLYPYAFFTFAAFALLSAAHRTGTKVGVVNFGHCLTESKVGKQEHASFENMRKQFSTLIEDNDNQLKEVSEQLQDKDYLDGISLEAEEQLKGKQNQLTEELNRLHQQYYQLMQQSQYKSMQTVLSAIQTAASKLAPNKGVDLVINREACFYVGDAFDMTPEMIKEMDKHFEEENKAEAVEISEKNG